MDFLSLGYFRSGFGGAVQYTVVPPGQLVMELITVGGVYDPSGEHYCGPGWVFVHRAGQNTIWRSKEDDRYECTVFRWRDDGSSTWLRSFSWGDEHRATEFSQEMLYAVHNMGVSMAILGPMIWSRLKYMEALHIMQHRRMNDPIAVTQTVKIIEERFCSDLSMRDLSKEVGMSSSHLHAQFKQAVGMSPHQYILKKRMDKAKHQLVTSREPIKWIAADVGFANVENFCRAFKKQMGMTAASYRKHYTMPEPIHLGPEGLEPIDAKGKRLGTPSS